jgi:three-Cys-motif partner protein
MVKKSHAEDQVGPWAEEKLSNLEDYLRYYCTALSKQRLILVYVDGFAGAPVTTVRQNAVTTAHSLPLWDFEDDDDREQFVLGSPVRALSLTPGFDKHYFFDLDTRRAASLEALKDVFPEKSINVIVGDANQKVKALVAKVRGLNSP